jgi:ribonuclease HI
MDELITVEFDGGSRGNPGPAGIGVVLRAKDGTPLITLGRFIGRATNNVAEYQALITGLQKAKELGAQKLLIRGDSELIIKQMKGEYRVRHPELKPLYEQAYQLLHQFKEAKLEHNLRHKNALADKLANLAMDKKKEITEADDDSSLDEPTATPAAAGDRLECMRCGMVIEVRTPSSLRPHQLKSLSCQCGQKMAGGRD